MATYKSWRCSRVLKFKNFLLKCQSIIGRNKWNALDSPGSICMLLSKLPGELGDRWNREVHSIRANHSRELERKNPINYVDKETALVGDPRKLLSSIWIKEMSRMIREEGLEVTQLN